MKNRYFERLYLVMVLAMPILVWATADYLVVSDRLLYQVGLVWGERAKARVLAWETLISQSHLKPSRDDMEILDEVNNYFNEVRWLSDKEHWGEDDYWATPIETLATNGGDCEDFAVGKYFTLLYAKVPAEMLRITYVKSLTYNQAHMILAYYPSPGEEPLVLDNINGKILLASDRQDLIPVYSFNSEGIWLAQARNRKLESSSVKSLPHWHALNARLRQQISQ